MGEKAGSENGSESDEGLDLPGVTLKQEVAAAESQTDALYKKATLLRDDLRGPLQEGRDGAEAIVEKLQEMKDRLAEKRPSAWRAQQQQQQATCSPSPSPSPEAGAGMLGVDEPARPVTPVSGSTTAADLEAELEAIKARRGIKDGSPHPLAAPAHDDELQALRTKVEELTAQLAEGGGSGAGVTSDGTGGGDLEQQLAAAREAVRKEYKTELQALRMETEDLRSEREELDRQIIGLKLDKEEAESRLLEFEEEKERTANEVRESVKKAERARIQQAAQQLQKELTAQNQKKLVELEERLRAEHIDEKEKLEERIHDLEMEVAALKFQINGAAANE